MTTKPSTTEDYASRAVLAFDLEDGLGRLQRAIRMLTVCQEAEAPKSDALAAAVDAVSACFERVEDEVMGPFCDREKRKQRILAHNNAMMDAAMPHRKVQRD